MNSKSTSKTTRLFFVRHGVTDQTGKILYGRTKGIDLNEEGILQAKMLAEHLAEIEIHGVFSSPLERAIQTAEIIAQPRGLEVVIKEDLIEMNTGTWTGMKLQDCYEKEEWKSVQNFPSQFRFPQGESYLDVLARIDLIVNDIVSFNEGKNILIAGHNGTITSLLSRYLSLPLDNYERIPCALGSVSEVQYSNGIGFVQSINVLPRQRMV